MYGTRVSPPDGRISSPTWRSSAGLFRATPTSANLVVVDERGGVGPFERARFRWVVVAGLMWTHQTFLSQAPADPAFGPARMHSEVDTLAISVGRAIS